MDRTAPSCSSCSGTESQVTGTINPGPNGTDFTGGMLNPEGWKFTLDVKNAKGGPIHFEGTISDLGKYKRVLSGKWTDARRHHRREVRPRVGQMKTNQYKKALLLAAMLAGANMALAASPTAAPRTADGKIRMDRVPGEKGLLGQSQLRRAWPRRA